PAWGVARLQYVAGRSNRLAIAEDTARASARRGAYYASSAFGATPSEGEGRSVEKKQSRGSTQNPSRSRGGLANVRPPIARYHCLPPSLSETEHAGALRERRRTNRVRYRRSVTRSDSPVPQGAPTGNRFRLDGEEPRRNHGSRRVSR